jgi:hypothetical protein
MSEEALLSPAVDVHGLRAERATIRRACAQIGELLTDAVVAGQDAVPDELATALGALAERWARHVRLTEAPDGLLNQIIADSPRLAGAVGRLDAEHAVVATELRSAQELLSAPTPDLAGVRRLVDWAMQAIEGHRRRGNQLIYDAYSLDIGLGE